MDFVRKLLNIKRPVLPSENYLENLMGKYTVDNLKIDEDEFKKELAKLLSLVDYEMEGFKSPSRQRDLSIKFHWGHDHDFGSFRLKGLMGRRHIKLLATFVDVFKVLPRKLDGYRILDVGCWTGGTSLLLAAMGAEVVTIDEVKKYINCLNFLKKAFGVENLEALPFSLYEIADMNNFIEKFDFVLFCGVLYHLSDPILGLRITFNCLRKGFCLLETATVSSSKNTLVYEGPNKFLGGKEEDLSRRGWNWFLPSPSTLSRMMKDVGYENVQIGKIVNRRLFATGEKTRYVDICRAGLSKPNIY